MRFNGIDLLTLHPDISIAKEIPPGMAEKNIRTIEQRRSERITGVDVMQGEYIVKVNLAATTWEEAWWLRTLVAGWASSSGENTAELEPTHWPSVVYDAIAKSIEAPKFTFHQAVMEVVFTLPEPFARDQIISIAKGTNKAIMQIGGTAEARPQITFTPDTGTPLLQLFANDKAFFAVKDVAKGENIAIDMDKGTLTIDGLPAMERIDYMHTDWAPGFLPGVYTITADVAGTIEARWYNRWA